MPTYTCSSCNKMFDHNKFTKYCDECRFKCDNCGRDKRSYGKYCDSCRMKLGLKKNQRKKCKYPGCNKMIWVKTFSSGYCAHHTQGRKKTSEAVKAYNQKKILMTKKLDLERLLNIKENKIHYIMQICDICQSVYLITFDTYMDDTTKCCSDRCGGIHAAKCNLKKSSDTSIEIAIEEQLIKQNCNYQKQVPLCGITIVDFFLPDHNIVIYCDGDYWHSFPDRREQDKRQVEVLESHGYTVYRFWERDIRQSAESCIQSIPIFSKK